MVRGEVVRIEVADGGVMSPLSLLFDMSCVLTANVRVRLKFGKCNWHLHI